ncbi:MAG: flagellar biosynthetic protein FliO [Verrucomicrobiota bacterium]|jgi:flagellar biogenesis protein FliO
MKFISISKACWLLPVCFLSSALAQTGTTSGAPLNEPSLPDTGLSFIRVIGALALVIGLFLGGVWLVRNWQRVGSHRGRAPRLSVLETRSLGGRHAIYVIGYERERFLIASSPGGVNLLSHLATATEDESSSPTNVSPAPSFAQALTNVLRGK